MKTEKIMKLKILAGLTLGLCTSISMAAQTSANITLSATIGAGSTCTIQSANTLDLGQYTNGSDSTATASFDIQCTGDANGSIDILSSAGTHSGELQGPSSLKVLKYDITVSPGNALWSIEPFSLSGGSLVHSSAFGTRVPAGEIFRNGGVMPNGVYSDTVQIVVDYL